MTTNIEHLRVPANGIHFHVATAGDKGAPPILFLHGFPEGWMSWRDVMGILSEYCVYALDMRGYGETERPKDGYDVFTLTDDIKELIAALGLQQGRRPDFPHGAYAARQRRLHLLGRDHAVRELRSGGRHLRRRRHDRVARVATDDDVLEPGARSVRTRSRIRRRPTLSRGRRAQSTSATERRARVTGEPCPRLHVLHGCVPGP